MWTRTRPTTDGRRRRLWVAIGQRIPLAALLALAGCGPSEPRPVELYPEDMCADCRMAVSDHRCASEVLTETGEVFKFDDISCLERFRAEHHEQIVAAVFVKEYETKAWLRLEGAVIVETGVFTPMGSGKLAFRDSTRAHEFLLRNPVSQ